MKFVEFSKYGEPEDLQFTEADCPIPKDNEVLVRIYATSINSWDWELLHATPFVNRLMFGLFKPKKLKTLGIDVAGCIEKTGKNVTKLQMGDEVYGDLSTCGWGGFAEYVAVPETELARKPSGISYEQAAAIPQAGLLALQGLVDMGNIQSGQKVLINGASGGSGSIAIQIAKTYDVEVTGVCSTEKMEFVRSLGADHVIDYNNEDFTRNGKQYDLILDAQGHHSVFDYKRALSPGGIYVMHGGASSSITQVMFLGPLLSLMGNKRLGLLFHRANKGLDIMNGFLASGKIVPDIDKCFPLTEITDALKYYGNGKARGKIVIRVEHDDTA